jgi:hypothetical protein
MQHIPTYLSERQKKCAYALINDARILYLRRMLVIEYNKEPVSGILHAGGIFTLNPKGQSNKAISDIIEMIKVIENGIMSFYGFEMSEFSKE